MVFAGLNPSAIALAALAAWLFGAFYYGLLGRIWQRAGDFSEEQRARLAAGPKANVGAYLTTLLAEGVMAWVLAGVIGHLGPGQVTLRNGVISALFIWAGFVMTVLVVTNAHAGRKNLLTAIDLGHWLGVLLIIGGVIGAMGLE